MRFMKDYKLYAFDLDLTLLDTIETSKIAYKAAFAAIGKTFDEGDVVRQLSISLQESFVEFNDPALSYQDYFDTFIDTARKTFLDHSHFYSDVFDVIKVLKAKGRTLAIITNRDGMVVELSLQKAGLLNYFSSIITSTNCHVLKPKPDPIYACLKETGVSKNDFVYFGDAKNDWMAAKNAGVDFVAVERYSNCKFPAEAKIHSLKEIL